MDVIVIGSSVIDLISYVENYPKPGETILSLSCDIGLGGKGGNQCVAARRLGAKTLFVSKVGDDQFGQQYRANLEPGINIENLLIEKGGATALAMITVNKKGENCIILNPGAELTIANVDYVEHEIKNSQVIVCQMEIPEKTTLKALSIARQHKVLTLLNVAPPKRDLNPLFFELSDIFCVNETEAEVTTGIAVKCIDDAKVAAKDIMRRGSKCAIVTLGENGAVIGMQNHVSHVPSISVEAIDTTGAGDAFVGAFAYFLTAKANRLEKTSSHSSNVHKIVEDHHQMVALVAKACQVAAFSVQHPGTQKSYPRRNQLPQDLFEE